MDTQAAPVHTNDVFNGGHPFPTSDEGGGHPFPTSVEGGGNPFPTSVEGGEEEHQGKKSSILTKVKEKGKKIKNSITKKVHGQGDHQQHGDVDEGDEGYEEDDEEVVDPEVHGAPIYESSAPRATEATAQNYPNTARGPHESLDAHAGVETPQDRPNARGGPDVGSDARARVGTTQDRPNYLGGPDVGADARAKVGTAQDRPHAHGGHVGDGAVGLGLIPAELAEDPAVNKTKENYRAGEEVDVSPELSRSFEAMAVSNQGQDQPKDTAKDQNSSYTEKISVAKDAAVSAASMVYGKVAEAGTAVMAKVKPEPARDATGEQENIGKPQDKGVSMKDYIAEKLSPGEDDRALSATITEAAPWKKDAAAVSPTTREVTGSGEAGGGLGVMGKIKETVTSFLGTGGSSSPKSASATESPTKVAEDTKDFHSRPPEAVSQEKALE